MDSILKKVHLASVNDTFKVVRFLRNGVLKCRYFDSIQKAGTQGKEAQGKHCLQLSVHKIILYDFYLILYKNIWGPAICIESK